MQSKFAGLPQALALATMVSSLSAASAWGAAGDNGQYFIVEGLWLVRDDSSGVALTEDNGFGSAPFLLVTADDVVPENAGGLRATAQFESFGTTWQVSAFGVVPFEEEFFASGLDPDSSGGILTGSTDPVYVGHLGNDVGTSNSSELDALFLRNESSLWGAELNWVHNLGGWGWNSLDLTAGVRYIHFGEELDSVAFDEASDITAPNFVDRTNIDVDNDLLGFQLGLQGMWHLAGSVSIGGSLKGGVAANFFSRDRSFASDDVPANSYADSTDDTGFAQFAEFNPRVDIALGESASLTIGGTVLWINDVSEATTHYESVADIDDANTRDDEDELFYGASIGLKLALN